MSGLDQLNPRADRSSAPNEDRLRIVMADDDQNDHLLMSMAAEAAGLEADFVFHDDGGLLLYRLERMIGTADLPDLIILDLRMPGINGHRTLEALQEHAVLSQIPVVVFSTSTRRADETKAYASGAHWFVTKPSTFDGMVEFASTLPRRAHRGAYELCDRTIDLTDADADDAAFIDEIGRYVDHDDHE